MTQIDRRALQEVWEQDCNWTYEGDPDVGAEAIDNLITRAIQAGRAGDAGRVYCNHARRARCVLCVLG